MAFPPPRNQRLYFNHIPKTAGTSLRLWLEQFFRPDECCPHLHDHPSLPNLAANPAWKFFAGHHAGSLIKQAGGGLATVTWLREPERQIASLYAYLHREAGALLEMVAAEMPSERIENYLRAARDLDFDGFVERMASAGGEFHNYYVRWLCSDHVPPALDAVNLGRARETLAGFAHAGIVERMQESVDVMCHRFKWPPFRFDLHANRGESAGAALSGPALAKFREDNGDFELHAFAGKLLDERAKAMRDELGADAAALHGALRFQFQAGGDPDLAARLCTEGEVIYGQGWQTRFPKGANMLLRWASAEEAVEAYAPLAAGSSHSLTFAVRYAKHRSVADALQIRVNGHPVRAELTKEPSGDFPNAIRCRAAIPASFIPPEFRYSLIEIGLPADAVSELRAARRDDDAPKSFATDGVFVEPAQ